jgi:hypothetical protein
MPNLSAGRTESFKSLGAGHLMNKVAIDIEEACAVLLPINQMRVPDLVE